MQRSRGFTLMEMVVVLAIIAILAAILTPVVTSYLDRAKLDRSTSDVKKIAAAIIQFNTDTRMWPIYSGTFTTVAGAVYTLESTSGNDAVVATGTGWPTAAGGTVPAPAPGSNDNGDLNAVLNQNSMALPISGTRAWRGPYTELAEDAWGTRYYLTSKFLQPGYATLHGAATGTPTPSAAYIISAGPNQTLDTIYDQAATSFMPAGDDIVIRIK